MRKSRASGAFESSIDWFWQTRQRSPSEMERARDSSAGSDRISSGWTARSGAIASKKKSSAAPNRFIASLRRNRLKPARCLRSPYPEATVAERHEAAEEHHEGADPDQRDERIEVDADGA